MEDVDLYELTEEVLGFSKGTWFEAHPSGFESYRVAGTDFGGYISLPAGVLEYQHSIVKKSKKDQPKSGTDMILPTDAQERKGIPITTGVLDYFPLAIAEVAKCSWAGNQQHHPGEELFWDKTKSTDHADCIGRHLIDRGKFDTDGVRHSAKLAWRALALAQRELEEDLKKGK